jgi:hypothetical protein
MADEKDNLTEAEIQIEKLKRLKDRKDIKEKQLKEEVFKYAELPHAVSADVNGPQPDEKPEPPAQMQDAETAPAAAVAGIKAAPAAKKRSNGMRVDRKNSGRLKKAVMSVKANNASIRLSEDMLLNIILARVMELNPDLSSAQSADDIRVILQKLKME